MVNVEDISDWKKSLGLLPIKLFASTNSDKDFILLNGGNGDFCLDINSDIPKDYLSAAWSSSTKNFVSIKENKIVVQNWKKGKSEEIEKSSIENNYNKFYKYLLSNSYKSEYDVVPFIINIFKRLRNLTDEKDKGVQAINILFWLMSVTEEQISVSSIDKAKWGLNDLSISPSEFE